MTGARGRRDSRALGREGTARLVILRRWSRRGRCSLGIDVRIEDLWLRQSNG